eukprot:508428_1
MKRKLSDCTFANPKKIKLDACINSHETHKCICGNTLIKIEDGSKLYELSAVCNICNVFAQKNQIYWHCMNASNAHTNDFDICDICIEYNENITENKSNNINIDDTKICENNISNCHHLPEFLSMIQKCNNITTNTKENTIKLLNHYLHFLDAHNDGESFEIISNKLSICNISNCNAIKRNYRNRNDRNNLLNISTEQQIIDKIHCYISHSYDIGYRMRESDRHAIDDHKLNE